jgi:hypothetical protein
MFNQLITQRGMVRALHWPKRSTLNLWADVLLASLLLGTVVSAYVDLQLHIWLGLASMVALSVHLKLHWPVLKALATRLTQRKLRFHWNWLVDVLLLAVFIPLVFSGMIVALIYAPNVSAFHEDMVYLFGGLLSLHLFLNRKWIASKLRGRQSRRQSQRARSH